MAYALEKIEKMRRLLPELVSRTLDIRMIKKMPKRQTDSNWIRAGAIMFVVVTSFFTYFYHYDVPQAPFWDEPYHIASAEKYLHGVFFMEPHPPLGKLLIAAGEKIFKQNVVTDTYIGTDYARDIPADFSYSGMRFFPALFGWLSAVLLFLCFVMITRQSVLSAALTTLYIFDNAEIVHSRGIMLDSTLAFTALLTIVFFLWILQTQKKGVIATALLALGFGASFGLAMTTKVVTLVLIVLVPLLIWRVRESWQRVAAFLLFSVIGFACTYIGVWMIHFSRATTIVETLPDNGYYQASEEYKTLLANKATSKLSSFPIMLRDSLRFVTHYSAGVPRLDLCKADENGSPSYLWPFGARTISYRWERAGDRGTKYLYLIANPVSWALGLLGVLLAVFLLFSDVTGNLATPLQSRTVIIALLLLYGGYMVGISQIERVMYLYHYFLPLLCSFLLFGACLPNIHRLGKRRIGVQEHTLIATVLGVFVFFAFQFYRPLTYYEPITDDAFARRSLLQSWEMVCAGCTRHSPLVIPRNDNE